MIQTILTLFGGALLAALLMATGPARAQEDTARFGSGATVLRVESTTDIAIFSPVMDRFVAENPDLSVAYEQWGSNDLFARSRAACNGTRPPADVVLSSAVQQMVWLVNAACAAPYLSARTQALPGARRWRDELWGITEEPAVIIYNKRLLAASDVPRSRFGLLDLMRSQPGRLRGRIATYDIEASGLGYLFAFSDSLEATTFGAMLEAFARVGAVATCCSAEIIRSVAEGRILIAYNVLGSYVAAAQEPDVGVILPEDYTLILSRSLMIPKGAAQPAAAGRLLEFLLGPQAQAMLMDIGLVMRVGPEETALLPSARRVIALSPAQLVALDAHRRARLIALHADAFRAEARE
ncbi:ABC transporter substrate-binding protein [Sagittula salina]|uniref:ABC transporter substrate-binding protein n=1 Tax=Sagittula salina TaxID=2820268 RepID=A0A940S2Y6_9RHOB|nr:ABC transporter substrate-binding protein [Sagittula salina]MBP0482464.1 ABC transporter substrate-binding protein [Sagittula salina]